MANLGILGPDTLTKNDLEDVGGKAIGLFQLKEAGVNVPAWFAIPHAWLDAQLKENKLTERFEEGLKRLSSLDYQQEAAAFDAECILLQHSLLSTSLLIGLQDKLQAALFALGDGPFAVRSSMVGEDSSTHSFAGQLESFLFQRRFEDVSDAIVKCWASAFSPRVMRYRLKAQGRLQQVRMGVIVQCMIEGDVSGVLFTANPQTGKRDEVLITAAYGQGEGIVNGTCNTDEYLWLAAGKEVHSNIANKDVQIIPAETNGTTQIDVPENLRLQPCLQEQDIKILLKGALGVSIQIGKPLDIEWTRANGTYYFLQARPITRLPEPENTDGPVVVFDNSNIQESYCGVTTPLTFSFASHAYESVYEQTMRVLGLSESVILAHKPLLRNLLGLVRGRIYYNINNWYKGLLLLPSFGRNKDDMEKMMGLSDPVDFISDDKSDLWTKLKKSPSLLKAAYFLWRECNALHKKVPLFLHNFEKNYHQFDRDHLGTLSFSQLMNKLGEIDKNFLRNWHIPIVNDFHVMMSMGRLRRLIDAVSIPHKSTFTAALMGAEEGIESTEPTHRLMAMAKLIRSQPKLNALFLHCSTQEILYTVKQEHPGITEQLQRYIERYGDRCMGELKLETITLREDPSFIIDVLKSYVQNPSLDPKVIEQREKERRSEAEKTLFAELSPLQAHKAKKILRHARQAVKDRENMRLARTRVFGLYRDVYQALGQRLAEASKLQHARDIFYLSIEEIRSYHEGRSINADLASIALVRKTEFESYTAQELPHHFSTKGPVYHGNRYKAPAAKKAPDNGSQLQGIGCYPGLIEGEACVILEPNGASLVAGKILVTLRTDPGWAPLFPSVKGILVERGSTLSHSAIVARELGIPAIVNIPGLLARIKSGDQLRLDGSSGEIDLL